MSNYKIIHNPNNLAINKLPVGIVRLQTDLYVSEVDNAKPRALQDLQLTKQGNRRGEEMLLKQLFKRPSKGTVYRRKGKEDGFQAALGSFYVWNNPRLRIVFSDEKSAQGLAEVLKEHYHSNPCVRDFRQVTLSYLGDAQTYLQREKKILQEQELAQNLNKLLQKKVSEPTEEDLRSFYNIIPAIRSSRERSDYINTFLRNQRE